MFRVPGTASSHSQITRRSTVTRISQWTHHSLWRKRSSTSHDQLTANGNLALLTLRTTLGAYYVTSFLRIMGGGGGGGVSSPKLGRVKLHRVGTPEMRWATIIFLRYLLPFPWTLTNQRHTSRLILTQTHWYILTDCLWPTNQQITFFLHIGLRGHRSEA